MGIHRIWIRRAGLPLLFVGGILVTGLWHLAAQGRYAPITEADVVAMKLNHYFTPDRQHHAAEFEWSFTKSEFVLKKDGGAIPDDLRGKLLPRGANADEIRGKWTLAQAEGETSKRLVLTAIKAGERAGNKEVRLVIYRTAPGVIRVGEPQYVFAREPDKQAEPDGAAPGKTRVELKSGPIVPGLPLGESKQPVHWVTLTAEVDEKGAARGTLIFDATDPEFDEFGDVLTGTELEVAAKKPEPIPPIELKVLIEPVKQGAVQRINEPPVLRQIYRLRSPKIKSTIFFATPGPGLTTGRLLVYGKGDRVQYVVELTDLAPKPRELLPPPCHPGCFPAGTRVLVPGGTALIERLRIGDIVTTITADGRARPTAVAHVFTTRNQLIELRTENGRLVSTRTQPVCLAGGGFRETAKLKAGDRIWQWHNGQRREVVVEGIVPTRREERVFNLIVGESAIFVAEDFMVRGKPPAILPIPVERVAVRWNHADNFLD